MKKRDYKSRGQKLFIDFLPKEIFKSLSPTDRKSYKKYRDNHRWMFQGEQKVIECKDEIDKLKVEIEKKQKQIKGWKDKMLEGYSNIGYLSKDYDFWCSVNLRKRKSKSFKNQEKGIISEGKKNYNTDDVYGDGSNTGRDRNNPSIGYTEWKENHERRQDKTPFEPPKLEYHEKYYIRIEPRSKEWIKNLYVGSKEKVIELLTSYSSLKDWKNESDDRIRETLRDLYKGYTRYQIYKTNPHEFRYGDKKHTYDDVLDWFSSGIDVNEWMDK